MSVVRMRLERLCDERQRAEQTIEELRAHAEGDGARDLSDAEVELVERHRSRIGELDQEIGVLADDLERQANSRDVSALLRGREVDQPQTIETRNGDPGSPVVYRTFAAYARDAIITRYPLIAAQVRGTDATEAEKTAAMERLQRAVQHTTTADIPGLLPPTHMAQIMDIIQAARPVVQSARQTNLASGKLTYPRVTQRPEVLKQGTVEKTEGGTKDMQVALDQVTADTYLGGGNLSWQTINWSTPDALQLWFDLAAEAYARATETAACSALASASMGTVTPPLGTSGTESFLQWRNAVLKGIGTIYTTNGGRARTQTLYLAADRFFSLAGLGDANVTNMSPIGNLDVASMTGTFNGLKVVGSYGFAPGIGIIGDSQAFIVAETAGAPVELRAVEPTIGGMEVGVIGAFAAKVYDPARFLRLS